MKAIFANSRKVYVLDDGGCLIGMEDITQSSVSITSNSLIPDIEFPQNSNQAIYGILKIIEKYIKTCKVYVIEHGHKFLLLNEPIKIRIKKKNVSFSEIIQNDQLFILV